MQQTCTKCGAVATVPSKFCRHCGDPLSAAQTPEAATRQYGRQTPPEAVPPASSPFSGNVAGQPPAPSVADAFAPDTARMHRQSAGHPAAPGAYQPVQPSSYSVPPPPKSNWWKWALGIALTTLLVCGGLLGYAFKRASDAVPNVQRKVEEAIAQAQKEAERAARDGGLPTVVPPGAPPPPPPPPGADGELTIETLRYPKSEQTSKVNLMGNQVLELKTGDSLPNVKAYYEKLLGEPLVESQEQGQRELVFQKVPYVVTIGHDQANKARLKINIVRSGWIPKLGDSGQK